MPRRSILSATERAALLAFPTTDDELIRHYTFTEPELAAIRQRRGSQNRLGFAVQLCYLRYPGFALPTDAEPPPALLALVARQLRVDPTVWPQYAQRAETRREHLAELQAWLNLTPFSRSDYRRLVRQLAELAQQTDRGIVLATALVEAVRAQRIIMALQEQAPENLRLAANHEKSKS
jgi:TnpA family transposase